MRAFALIAVALLAACNGGPIDRQPVRRPAPNLPIEQPPVEVRPFLLNIERTGNGRVFSLPAGIDCSPALNQCNASFDANQRVLLTVETPANSVFLGFGGACSGLGTQCEVLMFQAQTVSVTFGVKPVDPVPTDPTNPNPVPVANRHLAVSTSQGGSISSNDNRIACPSACASDYADGSNVSLSATPNAGFRFVEWIGACASQSPNNTSNTCPLTMSQDRETAALFAPLNPPAPVGAWFGTDMHVHNDHSSDGSAVRQGADDQGPGNVSIQDQIGQAVLKTLQFLPMTDHRTYDQHYDPTWESSDLILIPGEEANGGPHATVHGAVDTIVQGANPPGTPDFVNLQQSIWDAHSQGAVWVHAHPDDGHVEANENPNIKANAVGADLIESWNKASGVEKEINYGENRWNAGYRYGIVGASDSHFRELWAIVGPGTPRTDVFARQYSERSYLQALWNARTRISPSATAPQIEFSGDFQGDNVFEALGGDEVLVPRNQPAKLKIRIQNGVGTRVMLYKAPGRSAGALQTFNPTALDQTFMVDIQTPASPTWYRVEVRGPGEPAGVDTTAIRTGMVVGPQSGSDELRALAAPIFISERLVEPQPAIPTPNDVGIDDGARTVLGALGQFSGFPDIAVNGGVRHVVAEVHEDSRTTVQYRRVLADGRFAAPVTLNNSDSARFPKIAVLGSTVWAVWQDERAGQRPRRSAIYARSSNDGGQSWNAEVVVRSLAGRALHPDVAFYQGQPVFVWEEISAGNPFDVLAKIGESGSVMNLSRTGKTIMAASAADTRSSRYPASVWPSVAAQGDKLVVAFQDNRTDIDPLWTGSVQNGEGTDPDNWQILVSRFTGSTWSAPVALGLNTRCDRHPSAAFTNTGSLVVAWDSRTLQAAGANLSLQSAVSDDGGASFGAILPVGVQASAMSQYVRLGSGKNGEVQAVWYDNRSSDWRWRIATASYVNGWGETSLVPSKGINTWPSVDAGVTAFASTRNARRVQRDRTQQVVVR